MKHFTNKNFLTLFLYFLVIGIIYGKSHLNRAVCSISSISIPIGTSMPVMVYNARLESSNWKLTVLEKEHADKYQVEGSLFFSDKVSGESWYSDKNVGEKIFQSMRDAFSLCKNLNLDNKRTRVYEKNRLYDKYRTSSLPENLVLRKSNNEENRRRVQTSSFLQMKDTNEFSLDSSVEKALDDLENDDSLHSSKEDEYKSLNNDAYMQRQELERELHISNGETHNMDMMLD